MHPVNSDTRDNDLPLVRSSSDRLKSLDALRGFDMFWIIGGAGLVGTLADLTNWQVLHWISDQTVHVEWDGFKFWDLIFPLFLFIAGVAMPFSLSKRLTLGDDKRILTWHVIRRGLALVFLGLVYNGLLKFDFENLRCASVLARIGLGYLFAGLIVLNTGVRGQLAWCVGILLGYWGALMWIPVPGIGAGDLSPGNTLADYIDRGLLPGRLYHGVRDPEGIFSTIPAISTALMGALAGHWLRRTDPSGQKKALIILVAGGLCLPVGLFWNQWFPINKNLWSSSFVLYAGGWSLLFLGMFYLVIDVWGCTRWSFFFVVIGMNAITIYLLGEFIDFRALGEFVFAGSSGSLKKELLPSTGLLLQWLLLYGMYRRKLFLKV